MTFFKVVATVYAGHRGWTAVDTTKSLRLMTGDDASGYIFSHIDATGFPRLLPPARKIGLGRRALAGLQPSSKGEFVQAARFESSLERDFFVLLEFSVDVLRWDPQPIRLDLGGLGPYVPDVLVSYAGSGLIPKRHVLYEVKYREELKRCWSRLKPRYRMAMRFARSHGWAFRLVTEREIRTDLLWNAKFLLPYAHDAADPDDCQRLVETLREQDVTTPAGLLGRCSSDRMIQARLLTCLWYLVATRVVSVDLTCKLNMHSPIWVYD